MQPGTNVIPFPIIPRKPADRPKEQIYRCTECGRRELWCARVNYGVYCHEDGAEMRPVEGK